MEDYIKNMSNAELRMAFGPADVPGYGGTHPGSDPWMKFLIPAIIIVGCVVIAYWTTPTIQTRKNHEQTIT